MCAVWQYTQENLVKSVATEVNIFYRKEWLNVEISSSVLYGNTHRKTL